MELHASDLDDANNAAQFADEVRAEMARKRVTAAELAIALGVTAQTMGRRLSGQTPFNAIEMVIVARRLNVSLATLWERAAAPREVAKAS
jgi:hypothetical protein